MPGKIEPYKSGIHINESITLNCLLSSTPTWFYSKYDSKRKDTIASLLPSLKLLQYRGFYGVIHKARPMDTGYYLCYGSKKNMSGKFLALSLVKVYGKLIIRFLVAILLVQISRSC